MVAVVMAEHMNTVREKGSRNRLPFIRMQFLSLPEEFNFIPLWDG